MPTYSNPEFQWLFSEDIIRTGNDTNHDFFFTDISDWDPLPNENGGDATLFYTGFAQCGFLLRIQIHAQPKNDSRPIPWHTSHFKIKIPCATGTITVWDDDSYYEYNIYSMSILSYRLRHLELDDFLILANTTAGWSLGQVYFLGIPFYTKLVPMLQMTSFRIGHVISILPDQWEYVNFDSPQSLPSGIDITEYPVVKYMDSGKTHYDSSAERTTDIVAMLKARGNYFLFNNTNELQKRDFSFTSSVVPDKGVTDSQLFLTIGSSGPQQAYTINNSFNQVMTQPNRYNRTISSLPSTFKYFNNVKKETQYYTDLYDNNKGPTINNPYIIYNNMTKLIDARTSTNLHESDWNSNLFWIDQYTLYCAGKIYFIPQNWKIEIYTTTAYSFNYDSYYPGSGNSPSHTNESDLYTAKTNGDFYYFISTYSMYNMGNNHIFDPDNTWRPIIHSDIWQTQYGTFTITEKNYLPRYVESYGAAAAATWSIFSETNTSHIIKINYEAIKPKFLTWDYSSDYVPTISIEAVAGSYVNSDNTLIINQHSYKDPAVALTHVYRNFQLNLNYWNGLIPTTVNISNQGNLVSDLPTTPHDGYNSKVNSGGYVTSIHGWYAGVFGLYNLYGGYANPNGYCIVAYGPNWGSIIVTCVESDTNRCKLKWNLSEGTRPYRVWFEGYHPAEDEVTSWIAKYNVSCTISLDASEQTYIAIPKEDIPVNQGETRTYYYQFNE